MGPEPRTGPCRRNTRNLYIFPWESKKDQIFLVSSLLFGDNFDTKTVSQTRKKKHKKGIAQATLKSKNKYHSLEIHLPFFLAHVAGVGNSCSKSTCREQTTPHFSTLFAHTRRARLITLLFPRQENEKKTSAPQATFFPAFNFAISLCRICRYFNPFSSLLVAIGS